MRLFVISASISGALAVLLGAFGAHALKNMISAEMLEVYKTGVQYHFYHTFALLFVGLIGYFQQSKTLKWSGWLFSAGIFLFSGSLYLLAVTGLKIIGIITPFGGLCFVAGWVCLGLHASKNFKSV